ncbi:MAG: hypothetical protein DA407_13995 [Bacteroidetes bacterium]|nr:MAG: hypothetical protein DA407_13995 [Bacteroidota bacterium]
MIKFFRNLRQSHMERGKTSKYLKYAIGEIILVVIGILIALQINNWNEIRKTRTTEITFLKNIKADLELNLVSLDEFIISRQEAVKSSKLIIDYFNNPNSINLNNFNLHSINVMVWFPFQQNDNTYQELLNSGKLSIISNKDIKDQMQNMQSSFKTIKFVENEMQQDFESYLYDPFFSTADVDVAMRNLDAQTEQRSNIPEINADQINTLLKSISFKNGFALAAYNSDLLITEYSKMKATTNKLIKLIEQEVGN